MYKYCTNELWYMVTHIPSPLLGFIINKMGEILSLKNDKTDKKKVIPFYGNLFYGKHDTPGHANDVGEVWRLHLGRKKVFHLFCLFFLRCHFFYKCCNMERIHGRSTTFCCTKSLKTICLSVFLLQ